MRYQAILLDADGTMVDSEQVVVNSLAAALQEMQFPPPNDFLKELALRGTSQQVVDFLGISDAQAAIACWNRHWQALMPQCKLYPGIEETLYALKAAGIRLGLVTSRSNYECDADPSLMRLAPLFEARVCVDDVARPKPDPEPIRLCLERMGVSPENALYVGDSPTDGESARAAGAAFALALWGCRPGAHIPADHYLARAEDLCEIAQSPEARWLDWAKELQFIAQAGLTYSKDPFDQERFQRIREISAEIMHAGTDLPIERIDDLFCSETGFQTPKLDTRAALFDGNKILLVQERDGCWALPGGWVDVNQSIRDNALKEIREEAGLDAEFVKLIALQDRNRHNRPIYAYGICKAFVLCRALGGAFKQNIETSQSAYFPLDRLPPLAEEKTTAAQIRMCFAARSDSWQPPVD